MSDEIPTTTFWKGKRYTLGQVSALMKMHRYDQRIARLPKDPQKRKQRRQRLLELKQQAYAEFVAATLDK